MKSRSPLLSQAEITDIHPANEEEINKDLSGLDEPTAGMKFPKHRIGF